MESGWEGRKDIIIILKGLSNSYTYWLKEAEPSPVSTLKTRSALALTLVPPPPTLSRTLVEPTPARLVVEADTLA